MSALEDDTKAGLAPRGLVFTNLLTPDVDNLFSVFRDAYERRNNPSGMVNFGVAENSLLREELVRYFNTVGLQLSSKELAYNGRFTTSQKLVEALANLYNHYPDGYANRNDWADRKPLVPVKPDHIHVGSGAGAVLNSLAWTLCEKGEGVLLSLPYYNGFLYDFTFKAEATLVKVKLPIPEAGKSSHDQAWLKPDTVQSYELALLDAKEKGIKTRVLLYCNPHNPTGQIMPREMTIELLKLAAKYDLHFISDEIYSRSVYEPSPASPAPPQFHSVLSIDTLAVAGLHPSRVHVVSSASKDFSANGFRQGVCISQANSALLRALNMQNLPSQSSTIAGNLWANWLQDTEYLEWYLEENTRRLAVACSHTQRWLQVHDIRFVTSNAGHFFLVDFRRFLGGVNAEVSSDSSFDEIEDARKAEADLAGRLIKGKVFVAPGGQYEHPVPGWFRFTYSAEPHALLEGMERVENVLGLPAKAKEFGLLDLEGGAKQPPKRGLDAKTATESQGEGAKEALEDSNDSHKGSAHTSRSHTVAYPTLLSSAEQPRKSKRSLFQRLLSLALRDVIWN